MKRNLKMKIMMKIVIFFHDNFGSFFSCSLFASRHHWLLNYQLFFPLFLICFNEFNSEIKLFFYHFNRFFEVYSLFQPSMVNPQPNLLTIIFKWWTFFLQLFLAFWLSLGEKKKLSANLAFKDNDYGEDEEKQSTW